MDIKQVTVSNNDAGNIHFSIEIPSHPTLLKTKYIGVYLDVDLNPGNNDGGYDYAIWIDGNANSVGLRRWDGAKYVTIGSDVRGNYSGGATIDLNRSGFGSPSIIDFAVETFNWNGSQFTLDDRGPNSGSWRYNVLIGAPPPPPPPPPPPAPRQKLTVSGWSHGAPRAGDVFLTGLRVRDGTTNAVVSNGAVSCDGRIGSRGVRGHGYYSFDYGGYFCAWTLADRDVEKQIVVTETVTYRGASVSRTFQGTIKPPTETLKISRVEHLSVIAGSSFQATVTAHIVRAGGVQKSIKPARATCAAHAEGGGPLQAKPVELFATGVRCEWYVPSSARGRTVTFTVTIRSHNQTARKSFSARAH